MRTYSVFGGVLASPMLFPELPQSDVPPERATWTVERVETLPSAVSSRLIGADPITPEMIVRLYETSSGYRLDYGPLGIYDVVAGGSSIRWVAGIHDCEDCARQCVLGRVLALAIHLAGGFCLHGSCVEIGDSAVAFLAPKGTGKSTVASALVGVGARLITDDMLRVEIASATAYAGVQRLRLWSDSAAAAAEVGISSHQPATGKFIARFAEDAAARSEQAPLRAIYLLERAEEEGETPLSPIRERLSGSASVVALLSNAMLQGLASTRGIALLQPSAALAARVPVYRLAYPAGFDHLPMVAGTLMQWHRGGGDHSVDVQTNETLPRAVVR